MWRTATASIAAASRSRLVVYGQRATTASQHQPGGRRWVSSEGLATAEKQAQGANASLLLGRARLGPGAVVQQSNAIFAKIRGGQASASQLVEALQQLAAIAREASVEDLKTLTARAPFRQLLQELVLHLPRDAGERTAWGQGWTAQVVEALRELRVHEVDPKLGIRLGHTLVQDAPQMELESLSHAICNLCAADAQGLAPDDYAIWVLGVRLQELCHTELGALRLERLAPILHLLTHPALRGRVEARWSPGVLAHVRHGLTQQCSVADIAKLLQAYADVPAAGDVVSDALHVLAAHDVSEEGSDGDVTQSTSTGLVDAGLAELAAVAGVLPGRPSDDGIAVSVAAAVLRRLQEVLAADADVDLELATVCIAGAADSLLRASASVKSPEIVASSTPTDEALSTPFDDALTGLSAHLQRAVEQDPALSTVPAETLAQLMGLSVGRTQHAPAASSDADSPKAAPFAQPQAIATALAPRLGELSSARLVGLVTALASTTMESDPAIFEAIRTSATARGSSFTVHEFGVIAKALATASVVEESLFEAFDVEACLVRPVQPQTVAAIAWSMAVADAGDEAAWMLIAAQLETSRSAWNNAAIVDRGLLYEALSAHREVRQVSWDTGSAVTEILDDETWQGAWHELRKEVMPPSKHGNVVASLLEELGVRCERDQQGTDGLYLMPFALEEQKVVLDLLAVAPSHPGSRAVRGEIALRHRVWTASGSSVLAVPDSKWVDLEKVAAASGNQASPTSEAGASIVSDASTTAGLSAVRERQREWLQAQLESLRRADLVRETELPPDTAEQLKEVPFGDNGVGADALRVLAGQSAEVREAAVRNFLATWQNPKIENLTAWLIGAVKRTREIEKQKEQAIEQKKEAMSPQARAAAPGARAAQAKAATKPLQAAAAKAPVKQSQAAAVEKPLAGWEHDAGRSLEEVSIGDRLQGEVTNVLYGRVWVNVGLQKDVTFVDPSVDKDSPSKHKVGDKLRGLEVSAVDTKRKRVEVKPPHAGQPKERTAGASPRKTSGDARRTTTGESKAQRLRAAAAPKPESGWGHDAGRSLPEMVVGEVVEGRVTNVLYRRVWVNIGAEKDASFFNENDETFRVGDEISKLVVKSIDLERGHVQLQPPSSSQSTEEP